MLRIYFYKLIGIIFLLFQFFLLIFTEIDDLNTNILISKF